MTQLLFVCMSVSAILIADRGIADPAPGSPGNSGNRNPHGAPPGQGGTAPGNSGTSNPHGTPPGQRISPPSNTTSPGRPAAPSPGLGAGPRRVPNPPPGFGAPDPRAEEDARRAALRPTEELTRWLDRVKGWEPGWLNQFMEIERGRVEVTRSLTRDGVTRVSSEAWERDGDRFTGWGRDGEDPMRMWSIEPPFKRARTGDGPWVTTPIGPMRRLHSADGHNGSRMSGVWKLSVRSKQADPGGDVRVSWTRIPGGGLMSWIIESGTWRLRRLEARTADGQLEWVEERDYEDLNGRSVISHRLRRTFGDHSEVDDERIRWLPVSGDSALTRGRP